MGRTKAKKKMPPMPKLGFLDQVIYLVGFLLILMILAGLGWFRFFWIEDQMLAQPGAVAYEAKGSIYWGFPFYLTFLLSLFIPWNNLHSRRYPFFGKRGVKYGPPAYPRIFPLFMKNKPQYWKSPSEGRMRKTAAIFVVVLNLVFLLLVPLSIYGRNMLYEDGTLREYTVFDKIKREYEPEKAESVTLQIGWYRSGRYSSGYWRLTVSIDYGEHEYEFYNRSFGHEDWVDELDFVLREFDPDIICVQGEDRLANFARNFTEENYEKLCAIFERYG